MSARDELAKVLAAAKYPHLGKAWDAKDDRSPVKYYTRKEADAVLAAGYSKTRTITTIEELDALPVGSAVLNGRGNVCELFTVEFPGEDPAKVYSVPGSAEDWPIDRLALPAIVLHEGNAA